MSAAPTQLIVAALETEAGAQEALQALEEAKIDRLIRVKDAAVIRRDAENKVHVKNLRDAIVGARYPYRMSLLSFSALYRRL